MIFPAPFVIIPAAAGGYTFTAASHYFGFFVGYALSGSRQAALYGTQGSIDSGTAETTDGDAVLAFFTSANSDDEIEVDVNNTNGYRLDLNGTTYDFTGPTSSGYGTWRYTRSGNIGLVNATQYDINSVVAL